MSGTIAAESTILLVFGASGVLRNARQQQLHRVPVLVLWHDAEPFDAARRARGVRFEL